MHEANEDQCVTNSPISLVQACLEVHSVILIMLRRRTHAWICRCQYICR